MSTTQCPRCSQPCFTRLRYLKGIAGGVGIGLVLLFTLPFAQPTYCPKHGKIPLAEFPEPDRRRMQRRVAIQLLVTVVLFVTAISLVVLAWRS